MLQQIGRCAKCGTFSFFFFLTLCPYNPHFSSTFHLIKEICFSSIQVNSGLIFRHLKFVSVSLGQAQSIYRPINTPVEVLRVYENSGIFYSLQILSEKSLFYFVFGHFALIALHGDILGPHMAIAPQVLTVSLCPPHFNPGLLGFH